MKRTISLIILSVICFVLQTTLLPKLELASIMPNLLVVVTAVSGFMYGKNTGMFTGVFCGILIDIMYSSVIGVLIFTYALIGFLNGMVNKLYVKEDDTIPLLAIAGSDLLYGLLYFCFNFLLRGKLNLGYYLTRIIIPEIIYTVIIGYVLYMFIRWVDGKLYPEMEIPIHKKM